MARHRNDKKGRKLRHYGGAGGMTKHRTSGHSPRNRFAMMVNNIAFNRADSKAAEMKKRRRPEMFATVQEALKKK